MTKFIKSIIDKVKYRGYEIINHPINIDLVTKVQKSTFSYYPDNRGIPSIYFKGINTEWVYLRESDRDNEFETIVNTDYGR